MTTPQKQSDLQDDDGNLNPDVHKMVNENFDKLLWKEPLKQSEIELDELLIEVRHGRMSNTKAKAQIKTLITQSRMTTVSDFADWLHKEGYIDSDYYTEEPKAVDAFLATLQDKKGDT